MTEQVTLVIDGRELRAPRGERILWVALDAGIDLPNLCATRGREPPFGACRLCWVEIEGRPRPVTSCTAFAADGLVVRTRSERVDRLVASAFAMLMSHHNVDCGHCPARRRCGLRRIAQARKLRIRQNRFPQLELHGIVDDSHPVLRLDPTRCILCGRCVDACQTRGRGVLDFARRGLETVISTSGGRPLGEAGCADCSACADVCPVGALARKT